MHLLLTGDRKVCLPGGDYLRRHRSIRWRDNIDIETCILEVAELVGDDDRPVIGIHIPVEDELEFIVRLRSLS
jgi:hypothetical protein